MKDYNLIKYLAKLTGAKPKRDKDALYCYFPYSNEVSMTTFFMFKNKQSTAVYFDLGDIYNAYASGYSSLEAFVDDVVARYTFFEKRNVDGDLYVYSDLSVNRIENTASAALTNITVMVNCLNEMLGRNEDGYSEEEWRNLHRSMLSKQIKTANLCLAGGVGALILGVVCDGVIISQGGASGFGGLLFVLLAIVLTLGGPIAAIFFAIRKKYYKSQLTKSLNAKK